MTQRKTRLKGFASYFLIFFVLAPSAYGLSASVSTNGVGYSETVKGTSDQFFKDSAVLGEMGISHTITGTTDLAESHFVSSKAGDYAEIGARINGAKSQYYYSYDLYPGEGGGKSTDHVWASESLDVPAANYIKAYGQARNRLGYVSSASTEVTAGSLRGYSNLAFASADNANACQGFSRASGSIDTYTGSFLWSSQNIPKGKAAEQWAKIKTDTGIDTSVSGSLTCYTDSASKSATSSGSSQSGHVTGTFSSISTAGTASKTMNSNYGTDYDLAMQAKKDSSGSTAAGVQSYYINPSMVGLIPGKGAIQGAVDTAQSGETINVAGGTYSEDVNINKALTLEGTGNPTVNSFTLNAILGTGSGGITSALVTVNPGAKILDGINLAAQNGNVVVNPGQYEDNLNQNFYDKNIQLNAAPGVGVDSITLNMPLGNLGENFANFATQLVNVNSGGKVQEGVGLVSNGGNVEVGPGTFKENILISKPVIISGAGKGSGGTVIDGDGPAITINSGDEVSLSGMTIQGGTGAIGDIGDGLNQYHDVLMGGGILNYGKVNLDNCLITGNTADIGAGIFNYGTVNMNSGSEISGNAAKYTGGGYKIYGGDGIFNLGTVNMYSGSSIHDNTESSGGGIENWGTVNMYDGSSIYHNTASLGAGIFNRRIFSQNGQYYYGTVNMYSGSSIHDNTANHAGGGIFNFGGIVNMNPGSEISGNTALLNPMQGGTWNGGGGILNAGCSDYKTDEWYPGTLNLNGKISGNSANGPGGGVFSGIGIVNLYFTQDREGLLITQNTADADNYTPNHTDPDGSKGGGIGYTTETSFHYLDDWGNEISHPDDELPYVVFDNHLGSGVEDNINLA